MPLWGWKASVRTMKSAGKRRFFRRSQPPWRADPKLRCPIAGESVKSAGLLHHHHLDRAFLRLQVEAHPFRVTVEREVNRALPDAELSNLDLGKKSGQRGMEKADARSRRVY